MAETTQMCGQVAYVIPRAGALSLWVLTSLEVE